uniref:Uncharacterized protein n=1 Tax=viral metagenome TaxID=1070528 RepID=A0A6C0BDH8_9ZZZZ
MFKVPHTIVCPPKVVGYTISGKTVIKQHIHILGKCYQVSAFGQILMTCQET